MATWHDDKILELANQLSYSPAEKRHEQLRAALALLADIDPAKTYPWDLIHFRITTFQPVTHADHNIPGKILLADLSALLEFLSDTLSIRVEDAGETVLALEEITRKFNVSSKTIQRWRKQGLAALRYVYADGRRRLGFRESAVATFVEANKQRIERSAAFTQLSDEERAHIIAMARRLAVRTHCCMKDLSHRIAEKLGRSPETIRYTIRKYDRENPQTAIFPEPPSSSINSADIVSVINPETPVVADPVANAESAVHAAEHLIHERALRVKAQPIEFMPNPLFDHPEAENIILNVLPVEALAKAQATVAAGTNVKSADVYMARVPRDLPPYLAEIFREPIMPHELETDAFRRLNFLKFRAAALQAQLDPDTATDDELAAIESRLAQANQIKNELVQSNLRIAVHVARKHERPDRPLTELFSDATVWLMRSVDRFDFARTGHARFSTYASYAIMKNFARDRVDQLTRRDSTMVTGQEELLAALGDRNATTPLDQIDAANLQAALLTAIEELPARERTLVTRHYGLDQTLEAQSLAQIGASMGITKARVRQLETRALRRLRTLMDARKAKLASRAK